MFNWFDCTVLVIVVLGAKAGRKCGFSAEFGVCLQWIAILFSGAFLYQPLGDMLAESWPFSRLFCYLVAYIGSALIVKFAFSFLTRGAGGKLITANTFGAGEHYLGMCAGAVRFLCIILAGLALLNARLYTPQGPRASIMTQKDTYSAILMPNISTLQTQIFVKSVTGQMVKRELDFFLIKSTVAEHKGLHRKKEELL